jgi:peptidoglycan/LPS O-acetylase OafA/YrhL
VLLVMLHHGAPGFIHSGFYGVDVFFVLSGFLITTLLLEELERRGTVDIKRFFARRALRLLPAFLFALACGLALVALFPPIDASFIRVLRDLPYSLIYISDIRQGMMHHRIPVFGHTWSLSIEEHFYLLWPFVLLYTSKRGGYRAVRMTALIGIVAIVSLRLYLTQSQDGMFMYFSPQVRSDSLLLGCLLATLRWDDTFMPVLRRYASWIAGTSMTIIVFMSVWQPPMGIAFAVVAGFSIVGIASALLIGTATAQPSGFFSRLLQTRPFVKLGKLSYAVYLWNYVLASTAGAHISNRPVAFVVVIALTIVFAQLSATFVEAPFLRRKRQLASA